MFRQLAVLIVGTLLFWVALVYPAGQLWGESAVVFSAVAMGICLAPAILTLLWVHWSYDQSPEQRLVAGLGGSGVRMGVVLATGLLLNANVPYFQPESFCIWVLVFYLYTVGLEVMLLVMGRSGATGSLVRDGGDNRT